MSPAKPSLAIAPGSAPQPPVAASAAPPAVPPAPAAPAPAASAPYRPPQVNNWDDAIRLLGITATAAELQQKGITAADGFTLEEIKILKKEYGITITQAAFDLLSKGGEDEFVNADGSVNGDGLIELEDIQKFAAETLADIALGDDENTKMVVAKYLFANKFKLVDKDEAVKEFSDKYFTGGAVDISAKDLLSHTSSKLKDAVKAVLGKLLGREIKDDEAGTINKDQLGRLFVTLSFLGHIDNPVDVFAPARGIPKIEKDSSRAFLAWYTEGTDGAVKEGEKDKVEGDRRSVKLTGDEALRRAIQHLQEKIQIYSTTRPDKVLEAFNGILSNGKVIKEELSEGKMISIEVEFALDDADKPQIHKMYIEYLTKLAESKLSSKEYAKALDYYLSAWDKAKEANLEQRQKTELYKSIIQLVKKWSDEETPSGADAAPLDRVANLIESEKELFKEYINSRDIRKDEEKEAASAKLEKKKGKEPERIKLDESCIVRFKREYTARISSIKKGQKYAYAKALLPGVPDFNGNGWDKKDNLPSEDGTTVAGGVPAPARREGTTGKIPKSAPKTTPKEGSRPRIRKFK